METPAGLSTSRGAPPVHARPARSARMPLELMFYETLREPPLLAVRRPRNCSATPLDFKTGFSYNGGLESDEVATDKSAGARVGIGVAIQPMHLSEQ